MTRFLFRRLVLLPVILLVAHAGGFVYAVLAGRLVQASGPFGGGVESQPASVWVLYRNTLDALRQGEWGADPRGVGTSLKETLGNAFKASAELLGVTFALSLMAGFWLGVTAVQHDPPAARAWLSVFTTLGLAVPGFYIGVLLITLILGLSLSSGRPPLLPVGGYGWKTEWILPVLALSLRPMVQVARVTGGLLSDELGARYVTAARGFGHTWRNIRWRQAMRAILAPLLMHISAAFRACVAELVLVEWLFNWSGAGRLLASVLVPPRLGSIGGMTDTGLLFLHPSLLAALLVAFTLAFFLMDTLTGTLARAVDPRLTLPVEGEEVQHV